MTNIYSQECKFVLIGDVDCAEQVFDHLVKVRHTLTGQEGLLLCSHYSRWPAELISEATWLAGCFTPDRWIDDERLVFGAIPNQTIDWEIDTIGGTVILSVGNYSADQSILGQERVALLPQSYAVEDVTPSMKRAILAANRVLLPGERSLTSLERLKAVSTFLYSDPRYISGEWHYVAVVLGIAWSNSEMEDLLYEEVSVSYYTDDRYRTYSQSKETAFGSIRLWLFKRNSWAIEELNEEQLDFKEDQLVVSCVDNTSPLPLQRDEEGDLVVISDLYDTAVGIGYKPAVALDGYWSTKNPGCPQRRSLDLCHWVVINEPSYGYARAVDLPEF